MARKGWPRAEGIPEVSYAERQAIVAYELFVMACAHIENLPTTQQVQVVEQLRDSGYSQSAAWHTLVADLLNWLRD